MQRNTLLLVLLVLATLVHAQNENSNKYVNVAERLLSTEGKLTIGGYAQVDYNQPLDEEYRKNGILDVHRMVMMFGYNFNEKTQFITEIEFEHVIEVYIEQAFLQHKINHWLQFRGGLLLIPMGIINEYHEPSAFLGVERPFLDNAISPTTWREIGAGFTGNILPASLKYQLYVVNGFNGYDGAAKLSGSKGLRSGRQKGADSYISSPNLTFKIEHFGIRGLNLGLSGYFGNTQSKLYNGIARNNAEAMAKADSSVVGIAMLGADARFNLAGLQLRGQYYYTALSNTEAYNQFTGTAGKQNDLGSAMGGFYLKAGYNIMRHFPSISYAMIPFVRYENFDTHLSVTSHFTKNVAYNKSYLTTGIDLLLTPGAVVKVDMQWHKTGASPKSARTINAGIGVMF